MSKAKELLAVASKAAVREFNRDGELPPDFLIEDSNGIRILIRFADGLGGNTRKDAIAAKMREIFRDKDIVRYAFSTEAWMVDGTRLPDKGESAMAMQKRGESLEYHSDRIEGVTVFVEDRETKEVYHRSYHILRPEHGKPTLSPPRDMPMEKVQSEGRFTNMFEDEK